MKQIIEGKDFPKFLKALEEKEKAQKPFIEFMQAMNAEFKAFTAEKFTQRTANKHSFIVECFIDFITYDCGLVDLQDLTKGMVNSSFQSWFKRKIGANSKEEVAVAMKKFLSFLTENKGFVINNLAENPKKATPKKDKPAKPALTKDKPAKDV